jgi:hypothetical protein
MSLFVPLLEFNQNHEPVRLLVPCWNLTNIEFRRSRKARLEKPLFAQSASSNIVDMINCLRRINVSCPRSRVCAIQRGQAKHPFTVLKYRAPKTLQMRTL